MPHWLDQIKDAALNVVTLGEHEHPGGLREYGLGQAQSLDPRTREGLTNLAAMLIPGKFSPAQKMYLEQLRTHQGGGKFGSFVPEEASRWIPQEITENSRMPYKAKTSSYYPMRRGEILNDPGARQIAELLGLTTMPPMNTLLNNVGKNERLPFDRQAVNRLGMRRDLASSDLTSIRPRPEGLPSVNTPIMNPNSQVLVDLIARSNINRRN